MALLHGRAGRLTAQNVGQFPNVYMKLSGLEYFADDGPLCAHHAQRRVQAMPSPAPVFTQPRHRPDPLVRPRPRGAGGAAGGRRYESAVPFTRRVLEAFGARRLVWGSGTPAIVGGPPARFPPLGTVLGAQGVFTTILTVL
jgi:hypothetical protein